MVELHPKHACAVLDDFAMGIVLLDRNERVSWVNPYAENLLGADADAMIGCDIHELPVPYAVPVAGKDAQVRVSGALIGITQAHRHAGQNGAIVTLLDRGHTLVWFLSALSSGIPGTVAESGILTRAATVSRLDAEISRSRRYSNPLSCISVSARGTALEDITEIGRTLKGQLRWVDLLGEWREDVLLVVLPETDGDAADALASKLAQAVAASLPALQARLTIGNALWLRGDNAEQLVERALHNGSPIAGCPHALNSPQVPR
jgi:hypothetical protein